jgi:DNA-binding transcriptional MocR family regulator
LELIRGGFLDEHLPVLRRAYRERRDVMLEALERHWVEPGRA